MRPLELLLVLTLPVTYFWQMLPRRWRKGEQVVTTVPAFTALLAVAHLYRERSRWQMGPAYLLSILNVLFAFYGRLRGLPDSAYARFGGFIGAVGTAIAAALPAALPVPHFPDPTGPYAVGTTIRHLVDTSRPDPHGSDRHRELMVQIWYPVAPGTKGETAPFLDHIESVAPILARRLKLPDFFMNHARLVHTQSLRRAPLAPGDKRFPVLLFSHGLSGIRTQNITQCQELASHGYIVVAADHTHGAVMTMLPPDRVILFDSKLLDFSSVESTQRTGHRLVNVWAQDLQFMLDTVEAWQAGQQPAGDADGPNFAGRLDLSRIGVFGHSTGGAACIELCARDNRPRATVIYDGWFAPISPRVREEGIHQPALLLLASGQFFSDEHKAAARRFYEQLPAGSGWGVIAGTEHYNFSDIPLLTPLTPQLKLAGKINGPYCHNIISRYTTAFFDHHLKGQPHPLLQQAKAPYPEMVFEQKLVRG